MHKIPAHPGPGCAKPDPGEPGAGDTGDEQEEDVEEIEGDTATVGADEEEEDYNSNPNSTTNEVNANTIL